MNYPFWDIPHIGSGWVIGMIAIFHVMISQFAVGGGLYLPLAERKAMRMADKEIGAAWLKQLVSHSKFFLILTGVFGTVSGVGIWFAIGLTHPEATSTLIHNFVFGWAIEWVFFMVELTTIAVYYYTWNRIDPKLHLTVGWVYAGASVCTLIIINGILTFMLTPGDTWLAVAGTGHEASKFWNAFFNPTYWPSLLLRTGVCTSLAGIWALITSSRIDGDKQPALKTSLVQVERQVAGAVIRRHAVPAGVVSLHGPAVAAGVAHAGHRHHRRRDILHGHAHRAHHHRYLGDHHRRGLLSRLSQPRRLQSLPRCQRSSAGADRYRLRRICARDAAQALCHRPLDVLQRSPGDIRKPHQYRKAIWPTRSGPGTATAPPSHQATRAAKPSSAASAARATLSPAIGRSSNCSKAATAPTSTALSSCFTTTSRTRPTTSSCRRWWAPHRTSKI